jgi:2',3'-cyclic-nucleotide 2'-phosphodiesterase (5'-nucleotidase family)
LDAGDLLFKKFSQPISANERNKFAEKAYLIIESFNQMGYDAIGIGDDDLSLGKEFLMQISKKANFPFLSSNVMDEESGKPLFKPSLLKEIDGLRIGIFSLLSPDLFLGPSDPRKKGLLFQSPIETAQEMVKKLQPKADLIILLSHLSYPKDVELARAVQGIHFIIGGHTGGNLIHPTLIKDTYIFQTASRGMYVGRIDLTLHNSVPSFYDSSEKRQWESRLRFIKSRLLSKQISGTERAQWRKAEEDTEHALAQLQGKNELTNIIFPLREGLKDHPDILKRIGEYHSKYPEKEKPASSK